MKEVVHKMFERLWKKIEEQFNTQFEVEGMDPVEPLDRDLAQRMQEIDARVEAAAGRIREIRQEVRYIFNTKKIVTLHTYFPIKRTGT